MLSLVIHKVNTGLLKVNLSNKKHFIWLAPCVQISSMQRVWMQNWRNARACPTPQNSNTLRVTLSCSSLISWISFHLLGSWVLWTESMNCRVPVRRRLSVPGRPSTQVINKSGGSNFRVDRDQCLFSWNTSTLALRIFLHYICLTMTFSCIIWSGSVLNVNEIIISLNFDAWILMCPMIHEIGMCLLIISWYFVFYLLLVCSILYWVAYPDVFWCVMFL